MRFTRRKFPEAPVRVGLWPRNAREAASTLRVLSQFRLLHRNRITVFVLDNVTIERETEKAIQFLIQGAHLPWAQTVWIPRRYVDTMRFPPGARPPFGRVEILSYFFTQIGKDQDTAIKRVLAGNETNFNLEAHPDSDLTPRPINGLGPWTGGVTPMILPAARFPPPAQPDDTRRINSTTSSTPPRNPSNGDLWRDADDNRQYVFFEGRWVAMTGGSSLAGRPGGNRIRRRP